MTTSANCYRLAFTCYHVSLPIFLTFQAFQFPDMVHYKVVSQTTQLTYFGFKPFNQTCSPRSVDSFWHRVTVRVIRRLLTFESIIVKVSLFYTCFGFILHDKQAVLSILLVYLSCAALIFACIRLVHTVFHYVLEIV